MINIQNILLVLAVIIFAPILGGIVSGIDRKITAKMQHRFGPPILQPFYDFFKLMGKERIAVNQTQMVYVLCYLFFTILSLVMFFLKQDLIMLIFDLFLLL